MAINPDGRTPTKKKSSKKRTIRETMSPDLQEIMRNRGIASNYVGGNFGSRPSGFGVWKPGNGPSNAPYLPTGQTGREAMLRNYIRSVGQSGGQSTAADINRPATGGGGFAEFAKGIAGIADYARGVAQSAGAESYAAGPSYAAPGNDYQAMLEGILNSGIGAGIEAPDPAAMAAEQFAPQYDLLNNLRSQTTGRMNQQAADSQAMYNDLASAIEGDKTSVGKQYDTTAQNLDAAFGGAASAIQQTGDKTNADVNAMMRRLGISAAAPDTMATIAEDQNRSANAVAELQANYSGANSANRQSMMDYLTNEANTTQVAGANARADVERRLADALAGYDNQELTFKGQEMAAQNEYQMSIDEMQADSSVQQQEMAIDIIQRMMEADQFERQFAFDQQNTQWDQQTDVWNNELRRAAEERALRELEIGGVGNEGSSTKDASTILTQEAAQLFDDPQMANAVSQRIREALASGDITTVAQLLRALQQRHPGNPYASQYSHLGSVYGQALGLR